MQFWQLISLLNTFAGSTLKANRNAAFITINRKEVSMKAVEKFIAIAAIASLFLGKAFSQTCASFASKNNSGVTLGLCAQQSPDANAEANAITAYEPAAYSTIRCRIGETVEIKFTYGRNVHEGLYYGHLTREGGRDNVPKNIGTSPADISHWMFGEPGKGSWRNMFAYPGDEEGLQLRSSQVSSKIGFKSSQNNLITLKIDIPEKGGFSSDNWDLNSSVLWISIAQYHKDTPLYYCLDAREGTLIDTENAARKSNPISIAAKASGISIALPDNSPSRISIRTLDGRLVWQKSTARQSISINRAALARGMYVVTAQSNTFKATRSCFIP
ncbi:MAG: T9SS type A sorting domain-containing protein [Chitinivibrionales bacterium]|nr:T9SS type A sorting domain-containing protein [Chitinivibrionales bacterium]